jgi:xanthine dehydrogenase YagT iron-sulfur-binding subunit
LREGAAKNRDEIKKYMQRNICRCGSYQNIVDAIEEVKKSGVKV